MLDRLGVDHDVIERAELVKRFPQFNYDGVALGFYVPSTGILKCREGFGQPNTNCDKIRRGRVTSQQETRDGQ